jgi:hypothetical protein
MAHSTNRDVQMGPSTRRDRAVTIAKRLLLAVLVLDATLLAVLEVFYLPLRLPPSAGGLPLPLTVALAAISTPLLVSAAARLAPRLPVAGAPLAGWLATVLVLGLTGPGGDAVLPADFRTLLLMVAALVPSGLVLGRLATSGHLGRKDPDGV